jgi:Uma2 family endonuclease
LQVATTAVSPEILERLFGDTDERYELVNGELIGKPMVSIYHNPLMSHVGYVLISKLKENRQSGRVFGC